MTHTPKHFTDHEAATMLSFLKGSLGNLDQQLVTLLPSATPAELEAVLDAIGRAFMTATQYSLVMNDPDASEADRRAVVMGGVA